MKVGARGVKALSKPLSLSVAALLLLLFSHSALLFVAAVVVASAVGLSNLYRMIRRPETIRLSSAFAVSILLGYGLGSTIYLASNQTIHATRYQYWAPQGLLFNQEGLAIGLAASLLAAAVLYMVATFERPAYTGFGSDSLGSPKAERLVWLGLAVSVLALYAGNIGYMGVAVSDPGNVAPLGVIANLMVPPLVPYTLLLITDKRPLARRAMLVAALLFLIGVLFLVGRRYLLYAAVLSAIALCMRRGYKFSKRELAIAVGFSVLAGVVLYWGFNFFMAMRLAESEPGGNASLLELGRAALSQLSGAQASVVRGQLAENVGSRPFILSYLAGLMEISSSRMPAFGAELFYSLQMAIPSVLMPGKVAALPPSPEYLVHPRYGIPVFDGPNSALVAGFDDFGFLGALVYPLGVAVLYGWYNKALRTVVRDSAIRLFVLFAILFQLLYVEQALASTFVTLRDLTILVGVAWILGKLPILRLARHRSPRSSLPPAERIHPAQLALRQDRESTFNDRR